MNFGDWTFWILLGFATLALALGVTLFWSARSIINPSWLVALSTWNERENLARLRQWGALSSEASDGDCQSLLSEFATRASYGVFGAGTACVMSAAGIVVFALVARDTLTHLADNDAGFAILGSCIAAVAFPEAGQWLGWVIADKRLLRERPLAVAGERRALSDFAAPWVWAIPLLALAAALAFDGWLIAQSTDPIATLRALAGAVLVAGVAFGSGTIMLLSARWLARSPNVIEAASPQTTQRANDCFKASRANHQLGSYWLLTAFTLMGTVESWGQFSALRPIIADGVGLLAVALVASMWFGALTLLLASSTGYLGGRLTGWWWRPRDQRV